MHWDRREAYGADWSRVAEAPPDLTVPVPGYLGPNYRGIVLLDMNPSSAPERRTAHREWDARFKRWRDEGTIEAYSAVFEAYLRYFPTLRYWKQKVQPVLRSAGITPREVCYLNLSKSAIRGNKQPTKGIIRADWHWTDRQLQLLAPRFVVAGGKGVGHLLDGLMPNPRFEVRVQDRMQGQKSSVVTAEAGRIGRAIKAALAKNE